MPQAMSNYWSATRHPWSCVLFVLPLLVIYEVGLYLMGPTPTEQMRNGADVWLREGLASVGVAATFAAPVILVVILVFWAVLYREEKPDDRVGVWIGMTIESAFFAVVLYGLSVGLWPMLNATGKLFLATPSPGRVTEPAVQHLVRYLGAGIYEETLFRLLLFSALLALFNLGDLPRLWGILFASVASALLFAAAHNFGPHGEAFHPHIFIFRTSAGLFFAWLYCMRGFGIAVGAHAGYDVMVGILMRG